MLHTLKQIELGEQQHHCEIYNRANQTHCNDIKSRQTAPIRAPYILNVLLVSNVFYHFNSRWRLQTFPWEEYKLTSTRVTLKCNQSEWSIEHECNSVLYPDLKLDKKIRNHTDPKKIHH